MASWKHYNLIFIALVLIVAIGESHGRKESGDDKAGTVSVKGLKGEGYSSRVKRYILYDVNPGEGFNLKRDIFVRVAPIMKSLNQMDKKSTWTLVLHPWGKLVHWSASRYFPWKTFFDVDEIRKYIPVIEFEDFMEEHGMDNDMDRYYQLQHFPLNSPISKDWPGNVHEVTCEKRLRFQRQEMTRNNDNVNCASNVSCDSPGLYSASIWQHTFYTKNPTCLGLKGDSSNLVKFLISLQSRFIMLDKAEVILWDHYGGPDWWGARKSLKFADHLLKIASEWTIRNIPNFNPNNLSSANYLGVHLRRKDFIDYRDNQPSLQDVAHQIYHVHQQLTTPQTPYVFIFIASDGSEEEIETIRNHLTDTGVSFNKFSLLRFTCNESPERNISEGECAIIDQIICSWSKYFLGTADSTFTLRIFEERELRGVHPDLNYNLLCAGKPFCPKATRWALP